jgi:hypothetical protein
MIPAARSWKKMDISMKMSLNDHEERYRGFGVARQYAAVADGKNGPAFSPQEAAHT